MVRFHLGLDDLASACFVCSPLQEAVLSLRMWTHPVHYPTQLPWFRRLRDAFTGLDPAHTRLLHCLIASNRWLPDFLTPRPASPWPDIQEELAALRATPPHRVPGDLERAYLPHDGAVPGPLRHGLHSPEHLLADIADALEAYWASCLAPAWWPRARSLLEADIAHRARTLAAGGADALFTDIDPQLRWDHGTLTIACERAPTAPAGVAIDGRGLVLSPTLFAQGAITAIDPEQAPLIIYPARGHGLMAEGHAPARVHRSLQRLLGSPRARLLLLLAEPASTTELAHRIGVTPSAVSQHLSVLHQARLTRRVRHGRNVLYSRTPLGDQLCDGTSD
ncbi:ArsR/SmtB family transcription factor [Streptomyces cinerochromogenes]|uniref:ArsR/SmtB family transcription factor n=1 Tax=Streptomyces cinerochromogenes TaxID=66422 RepID=A0ABW7BES3_9ACTN